MDDLELARLEHENLVASLGSIAAFADGGIVQHAEGIALIDTGLPVPFFNQILVEREEATAAALAAAVILARERQDPFLVDLRVGLDDRFIPLMDDLGLVAMTETPWMPGMAVAPIPKPAAPGGAGFEIRRVTHEAELEDLIVATIDGFGMDEQMVRSIVKPQILDRVASAFYVGYADGQPVSTGVGVITGRTIGVYNIATVPDARRRGYGEQMTRRVLTDGVAAGCAVAVLQASTMGFAIYERMGFRTVIEYMAYVEPQSPR